MRLKPLISLLACLLCSGLLFAQTTTNYSLVDNLNPVTPTMRQFTKYTDMPVSEYTGVPNISIPLYEIDEDGVKIPLELVYNSGGIRVNEEASWVGLGWDLTVGSIVQQINDIDDWTATTHLESDYVQSGTPELYPPKYNYCLAAGENGQCLQGCTGPMPIETVIASQGIEIYTNKWAPFNGNYNLPDYKNYFDEPHSYYSVDSEPDVFTANFLGHSIKFIIQWSSTNYPTFVVVNKKGYQISRTGNSWKILVPSGEEYDFAASGENTVQSQTNSQVFLTPGSTSPLLPSSNVWMLTQIITKNKKVITFNYTQTAVHPCLPTFTQRGMCTNVTGTFSGNPTAFCQATDNTNTSPPDLAGISSFTVATQTYSQEPSIYLSSITFPNGTVNFSLSSRSDLNTGMKLDSIEVMSPVQEVRSWQFNYGYMNSTTVGGNVFAFNDTVGMGNYSLYRLQLLSAQDNSGAKYTLAYNSTLLPAKNSFAVDYWGYYNGATSNTTVVPNATQFKQTGYYTNDNDNHSANLTYALAGMLTQIQYPTGGSVNFSYELNQFSNYWVPDYSENTNTISSGNGLRIQSIIWNDSGGAQLKQTNYSYNGGIASLPLNFFRSYNYGSMSPGFVSNGIPPNWRNYNINETNMSGCYSANPFASFNSVGYSQVTKTDVDNLGNTNGKEVTSYYNQPDEVYNSITYVAQTDPTLPAYKNPLDTADNGSLKSELYYNKSNTLEKQITYNYTNIFSSYFYGARRMDFATQVTYAEAQGGYNQLAYPLIMVGYYPIFDFESLVTGVTETDYFGSNAVTTTTANIYDNYNQLSQTSKTNSTYTQNTGFSHPYGYPNVPVLANMTAANRLTDIVNVITNTPGSVTNFKRGYMQNGSLFLASIDTSYINLTYNPEFTTYDQYDPSNGNILQYTKNTVPNSVLWDYNKEYVIADVKNALYTNVAYTSFEADGTGRWKFSGTTMPDANAPAGQKVYSLAGGNIYRDSLDATLTYVVSYWSKNGAQTVSGATATKTGYTINGYTYYESTVPTPSGGTITVSGTGTIDELRLYPNTAQMSSYTYAPLVGITSVSDAGGKISYYEYDNAMRLLDIRDHNKNILKAYCYNYAGEPTTCGLNITYSSQAVSQTFSKSCSTGYVGSPVAYSLPLGKYVSTMSLADANNQAQEDINVNGQNYANTNGTCVIPPIISNVQYGGHGTGYTEIVFSTIPGCTTATINYTDLTTNIPYASTGACSSPQFVTVPVVGHTYSFTVTCYSSAFPSGITSASYNYTANN